MPLRGCGAAGKSTLLCALQAGRGLLPRDGFAHARQALDAPGVHGCVRACARSVCADEAKWGLDEVRECSQSGCEAVDTALTNDRELATTCSKR